MCDTAIRGGGYGDPLSLLKNCDANALGKLCEAVSGITDDSLVYANFPKRSLVKCFSARDKYEWHVNQTAELEAMQKRWTAIKEGMGKKRNDRRQKPMSQVLKDEKRRIVAVVGREEPKSPVAAARESPPLQGVNDDILREALMVAEHFEESDEMSILSSDQKSPSEGGSETIKVPQFFSPRPSVANSPMTSASLSTTPRQHHRPSLNAQLQNNKSRPRLNTVGPFSSQFRGNAAVTVKSGLPAKANRRTPTTTPKKTKKSQDLLRNRSTGERLRGALGICLGSKHVSVDFSSSRSSQDTPMQRHASSGPATRRFFGSHRSKKSPSCRAHQTPGSFGSLKFRSATGDLKTSLSKAWK